MAVITFSGMSGAALAQDDGAGMNMDSLTALMMELAQPGPEHDILQSMVGTWEETITMWPQPGADSIVTTATSTTESILGGRFLLTRSTGSLFGQPLERYVMMGYDRRHDVVTLVAADNSGTYWVTASGPLIKETRTMDLYGEDVDPIFGFTQKYDMNITLRNDNEIHTEIIFKNPEMTGGAPEFKMIDVVSKRAD
ncbi:MAG: hypothetical protein Kow0074_04590 [Candidatus Zixiibacteriota bacterium]